MNRRRLAEQLARHALAVMAPERRPWALGMTAELAHIEDDGDALTFASGALYAAYGQAAGVWSNWLRVGRCGVSLGAALLALGLFYMSVWLARLPEAYDTAIPFSGLAVLLGFAYLGAAWSLVKRRLLPFFGVLVVIAAALAGAVATFPSGTDIGSPLAFYTALLRQESAPPHAFYAALLLEEFVFVTGLAAAGVFFWRFEPRRTST